MSAFKVGDRVRIKNEYGEAMSLPEFKALAGKVFTVTSVENVGSGQILHGDDIRPATAGIHAAWTEPAPAIIDPAKCYRTRDGKPARILATDVKGDEPIAAAVHFGDEGESVYTYSADGYFYNDKAESGLDLIEVKPAHTRWMVCAPDAGYATQEQAQEGAKRLDFLEDVAVVPVTFRAGDGL